MVTAVVVVAAAVLLAVGVLREDPVLVVGALVLSLLAVVVETAQVLRGRRDQRSPDPEAQPEAEVEAEVAEPEVEPAAEPEPEPEVEEEPEPAPEPAPEPEPVEEAQPEEDVTLVCLPGRVTYHRPDCVSVRGKRTVELDLEGDLSEVRLCRRCRPPMPTAHTATTSPDA